MLLQTSPASSINKLFNIQNSCNKKYSTLPEKITKQHYTKLNNKTKINHLQTSNITTITNTKNNTKGNNSKQENWKTIWFNPPFQK